MMFFGGLYLFFWDTLCVNQWKENEHLFSLLLQKNFDVCCCCVDMMITTRMMMMMCCCLKKVKKKKGIMHDTYKIIMTILYVQHAETMYGYFIITLLINNFIHYCTTHSASWFDGAWYIICNICIKCWVCFLKCPYQEKENFTDIYD